jgi:hypothetical protein
MRVDLLSALTLKVWDRADELRPPRPPCPPRPPRPLAPPSPSARPAPPVTSHTTPTACAKPLGAPVVALDEAVALDEPTSTSSLTLVRAFFTAGGSIAQCRLPPRFELFRLSEGGGTSAHIFSS